ncbi:cell division protein [Palaeococcus sp. (in: euryarchaeotes)]
MEMKKLIGNIMLTGGLIGGAISAARIPPMWGGVIGSLIIMGVGIVLRRRGEKEELHRATQKGSGGIQELERILTKAIEDVGEIMKIEEHNKVRESLSKVLEFLDGFAEKARPLRIESLKAYGQLMTAFSRAERSLNRAWSAYADGYEGEGRTYLEFGYEGLKETLNTLKSIE